MLRPEAGEGAEAAGPEEVQGRPCPLGGGGARPHCPRRAPGADGAGGGAEAPVRAGLAARRGDHLPARPYRSGRLKEQGEETGTEEEGGKLRSKPKEREKGKKCLDTCKRTGRFPAAGKQPAAAVFILPSRFAIYKKYVLIIPRGMRDPG